ncbi:MAG: Archaeal/vacuolar-type H+-ATPase subunit F [Candidatus Methanohalarchaeum thermophilum]|uniref:Archaeal/vacuolar-type H+-ATPase subunit F n=1 Tax=Methanohalarchaeum thermophilum TaxID=1903181 RepID=A0A1Q6DUT8_METT1|nr:MAG: Archaeal/vacuolar-type H+-ATPase subunit F [Candidatus Methanohalarchaeum thermophilum]
MRIAVLGDEETVTGFKLAGVSCSEVIESNQGFEEALNNLDQDIGIIITTEDLAKENQETINEFKSGKDVFPLLVEIPSKFGSTKESEIMDLVKKAIGVEINLEDI